MPQQKLAPASKPSHPSIQPSPVAPLAAKTTCDGIHLPWLSRLLLNVFLPIRQPSARAFSPRPQACSTIRASTRPSSCSPPVHRTGSPLTPSIPLASLRPSRPAAGPATPVSVSEIPLRFRAGSKEYDRRTAAGTWQTNCRGGPLLPRSFLLSSPPSIFTLRAALPQTPLKSALFPLPRKWRSRESLFPSNP